MSSSSSFWLSLTTSALSCARCWTRPVACQLLMSPLMVSAPSTAAVRLGTAMMAASRQRTRQLTRANRDRDEPGRLGCGWVVRTMLAGGGEPGGLWVAGTCCPAAPGPPARARARGRPGRRQPAGPAPASPRPDAPGPSPAALPPDRSPEPPPSACPPLTAPVAPVASPGFATDRLRTTFAPRIGKPGQRACRAKTAQAAQHTHPSFPPQRSPLLGPQGGRSHTLALQNG